MRMIFLLSVIAAGIIFLKIGKKKRSKCVAAGGMALILCAVIALIGWGIYSVAQDKWTKGKDGMTADAGALEKSDMADEEKNNEKENSDGNGCENGDTGSEQYEKGYDLPISDGEKERSEKECRKMMSRIQNLYKNCDKGDASNVIISDESALAMWEVLVESGEAVTYYDKTDMCNHEKLEEFLVRSEAGEKGSVVSYELHADAGIRRNEFIFDGTDMYLLSTNCVWNAANEPAISGTSYTRIKSWEYTQKGWFIYELCVPEPPEVTEVVNGICMVRVKPIDVQYRQFAQRYLDPVGYQGNNLFSSDWDVEHMEELDYNGLYEYLYMIKHQERFKSENYPNGISEAEFEALMEEYLPITVEQVREYAAFDETNQTYVWGRLGCLNYAPSAFDTSVPEVTQIKENNDGTLTVSVDAVCAMTGNDAIMSHVLTVEIDEDESIKYISNQVMDEGKSNIPSYHYRVDER
ncbi:MAG: hypothetical protein EOM40_11210 [Clostridia bacterium]|nr:hypothetical protein [Clostridia bacterium]NCC42800.1 hypothetical protein [Clostridia bacterium]